MKKILHNILRWILRIAGFLFLLFCIVFLWHKYAWTKYLDKQELIELSEQINNAKPLKNRFYEIYDQVYPGQRHVKFTKTYILSSFSYFINYDLPQKYLSPIRYIGHMSYLIDTKSKKLKNKKALPIYFSFALDKYTSPEKCFDFYINNFDFLHNTIGLEKASMYYFKKHIDFLTDKEIIGLIVMIDNPSYFNPKLYPDRYQKRVDEIFKKINKASA